MPAWLQGWQKKGGFTSRVLRFHGGAEGGGKGKGSHESVHLLSCGFYRVEGVRRALYRLGLQGGNPGRHTSATNSLLESSPSLKGKADLEGGGGGGGGRPHRDKIHIKKGKI